MKSRQRRFLQRLPASAGLVLAAMAQLSCFAEPTLQPTPTPAAGGASDEASAGAGGLGSTDTVEGVATLGIVHAAVGLPELEWALTQAERTAADGSLAFKEVRRLAELPVGAYTLTLKLGKRELSQELELTVDSALNVVLTADAEGDPNWQLHLLAAPRAPAADTADAADASETESPAAHLFVVNEARGGARELDVGNDGSAEGQVEPDQASPSLVLDVTRPALALVEGAAVSSTFTLPPPARGSTVLAVLLGDPAADGTAPEGERLLMVRLDGDGEAEEIRSDPVLYFVHASARHAGLDLFMARGTPLDTKISAVGSKSVPAFLPDNSVNQRRVLAEVADNARFGDLRIGRVPPSAATLELYLTIPGDPQAPAALNHNLVGNLLPNQRLRNGPAVGRQGTQTVGGELAAGAEYLLLAPSTGLFDSNHSALDAPKAPAFPFERVARSAPPSGQFSLRVAASVKTANTTQKTDISLDGSSVFGAVAIYTAGEPAILAAGTHELKVDIGPGISRTLTLEGQAGQELLVIAAGDAAPEQPSAPSDLRPDDSDGDGAVCSAIDPETSRFSDPNYLPLDGNSELIQDDCPDEPGPLAHQGCPATPLQWLILDFSTRPPSLRSVPMAE